MQASEKIETVNKKLTEAQRLADIGNWEWNIVEDKITWSDELYRIFGLIPGEFEASFQNYLRYIHPDERDHVSKIVQDAFINFQPFNFYHRVVRSDGTMRILHGRGEVNLDDKKQPISMAGTAQDVTEIKQAENEIRKITDELVRYNKELEQTNKALESFTFVASHDLQEPARKIRTFINLIAENEATNLSEKSKDYMNRTIRAATQMQQLIHDLLVYSRTTGSAEHFKKTDLNVVLGEVMNELKEMIEEKQATIEAAQLPELDVIPFQFHQFFMNMISNSLKFSGVESKPRIRIHADIVDQSSIDLVNADAHIRYHRVTISDNGIGFDAKYDEKIFDMFQRLHSKHKYTGTGIGLAICKKIIENHDGFITAHGEPKQWSHLHCLFAGENGPLKFCVAT
jgi:PAS domain S-box-containing protein